MDLIEPGLLVFPKLPFDKLRASGSYSFIESIWNVGIAAHFFQPEPIYRHQELG